MTPETIKKLAKIRRIANVMKGVCTGFIALVILVMAFAVIRIFAGYGVYVSASSIVTLPDPAVTAFGVTIPLLRGSPVEHVILAFIVALAIAIAAKCLMHLKQLFDCYSRGSIFTAEAAWQIRRLGITVMMAIVPNVLWVGAALAFAKDLAPRAIHLDLGILALGMVITFNSWFMEAAAELREESELTI